MEHYYQVLEIKPDASEKQIKNAYRELARKYHPDINPSPDAHERFIEIAEAYEVLKSGKKPNTHSSFDWGYDEDDYLRKQEEDRRQRAREYARMSYENFKKANEAFQRSWYFDLVRFLVYSLIAVTYLLALIFFLSPLVGYFIWGSNSLLVSIVLFLLSPHLYKAAKDIHKESKPYFGNY